MQYCPRTLVLVVERRAGAPAGGRCDYHQDVPPPRLGRSPELLQYAPNGPREECGVVGIHATGASVARLT